MPIAGQGMLLTSMDVDPLHEAEFNRWYDREHIEERVAIDGFVEARRYVAVEGQPKYLGLYSTATFDVLDSPAYRTALANQTDWSKANIARFENMIRAVARITISRGVGRGACLGIIRLRPVPGKEDELRALLHDALDPTGLDGVISMHLLESDPPRKRSASFEAAHSGRIRCRSGCRRLVLVDRPHRRQSTQVRRRAPQDLRAIHGLGRLRRQLSPALGSRKERSAAAVNVRCGGAVHAAPPHNAIEINAARTSAARKRMIGQFSLCLPRNGSNKITL